MSKKRYYVSVHSGEISGELLQDRAASAYEFEIEATDEQARELQNLINQHSEADAVTFWDAHIPFLNYDERKTNTGADKALQQIYRKVYELGTDETRQQIEKMNLLE